MYELNSKEEKRSFYKTVVALVFPMAIQNLINTGVQAADVAMLGRLGDVAISAASLAGQVYFIMTLFFFGMTSGAAVLTAQYWGKKDIDTIEKVLGMTVRTAFYISVLFALLALLFPKTLMRIFSNDADIINEGAKYLRIVAIAYIPASFTMVYLNIMRSVEKVIISTVVYSVSLGVNIILNAIFIFGLLGFPAMGVKGAAIATATARYVELIIVVFYALKINKTVKFRAKYLVLKDKILMSDFVKYSLPVTLNELLWGTGISAISAIIGRLGSAAVAANSVTNVVRQLSMVVTFGIANATAIILGKTIGEKKLDYAKIYSKRLVRLTFIIGVFAAILIVAISPLIRKFMMLGKQADYYLSYMLMVLAMVVVASETNATFIVGVFRAGGDTKVGLILDCGGLWLFALPLGLIAAFVLKLPVIAVFIILNSDEVVKLPFSISRYFSYKWLNDVTRDFN